MLVVFVVREVTDVRYGFRELLGGLVVRSRQRIRDLTEVMLHQVHGLELVVGEIPHRTWNEIAIKYLGSLETLPSSDTGISECFRRFVREWQLGAEIAHDGDV